jgi:hypothetical protein
MAGRRQVLFGIDVVRKICNHPDLLNRDKADEVKSYSDDDTGSQLVLMHPSLGSKLRRPREKWQNGCCQSFVIPLEERRTPSTAI